MRNKKIGFTLLEVLVVVIIIAVLAAIAVPMYKHAVLKSRFSTVMPMAKAVVDAQEVYYLGKSMYALGRDELDVTPITAEKASAQLSTERQDADDNYIYVAAQRTDIPGARYIVYQKHSPKFAGQIHCEAKSNDTDALWLCEKGLNGFSITGSVRGDGYNTYILQGSSKNNDTFTKQCPVSGNVSSIQCPSGCGMYTVTATCNTQTGAWNYEGDSSHCPTTCEYSGSHNSLCVGVDWQYGGMRCAGAVIKSGSKCLGGAEGGCDKASYQGGCCQGDLDERGIKQIATNGCPEEHLCSGNILDD